MAYRHANQHATKVADKIWIGNYLDGQDVGRFEKIGATAILDLADNISSRPAPCEIYVRCPFPDNKKAHPSKIVSAVLHLRALVVTGHPTLVHCKGGHSRSVTIYALHEVLYGNRDFDEVVAEVRSIRTLSNENPKAGLRVQADNALRLIFELILDKKL